MTLDLSPSQICEEPTDDENLTDEYPINTKDLAKGSRITAQQIEHATGVLRDAKNYSFAMLKLKGYITYRLANRGLDAVIRSQKDDLVILTDEEAAPYTDTKFQMRIQQAGHALREQLSVSRAGLLPEQIEDHDRACVVNGATYAGAKKARRGALSPTPTPRKRLTPTH